MKKIYFLPAMILVWVHVQGDVILTGIMDGTLVGGKPKAIELFIAGTEDLGGYEVWRSQNGDPFGAGMGSIAALGGIYTNTFVYLVKSDQLAEFQSVFGDSGFYANVILLSIVSGNGNEGFQIRDTTGNVVVDQLWLEDPAETYRDSFWYRNNGTGPDGAWVETHWYSPGNDALDDLDEAGLRAAVPFGSYAVVWRGLTTDWGDASNWSTGHVPGAECNVLIADTSAAYPVIMSPPGSPAECLDLTILETASLAIAPGMALTVHGDLLLQGAQAGDRMILQGENSSTPSGSLMLLGNTDSKITARLFISPDNSWHFLSSPVAEQSIQPGFVPDPPGFTFDFYAWQENAPLSSSWMNIRDESGALNPLFDSVFEQGKGYLAAYSMAFPGNPLKTFYGVPKTGDAALVVRHLNNHWNLLGNPYTCSLDWSSPGIDKSSISGDAMYIWDQALNSGSGGYRAHNGSYGVPAGTAPIIPSMNGFFVNSLDSGSIGINITVPGTLVHSDQPFYKAEREMTAEGLRLQVKKGNYSDETLLVFDALAGNGYDPALDVLKLPNGISHAPEISTVTEDGKNLCINYLGEYPVSIPLAIEYGFSDTLEIAAFEFEGLDPAAGLFLEDLEPGITQDLREEPVYRYLHDIQGSPQRFVLHITNLADMDHTESEIPFTIIVVDRRIVVKGLLNEIASMSIYDMAGRQLLRVPYRGPVNISQLGAGAYIVEVCAKNRVSRKKIIL